MIKNKDKIPYKLFFIVLSIVTLITFLIMNYNPVSITFIFFKVKAPLTLLFLICIIIGVIIATIYWKNKYNKIKNQLERTKKLLFVKEEIDSEISEGNNYGL